MLYNQTTPQTTYNHRMGVRQSSKRKGRANRRKGELNDEEDGGMGVKRRRKCSFYGGKEGIES